MITNSNEWGPTLPISIETHKVKYREGGESFKDCCVRQAHTLKDFEEHYYAYKDILLNQRFLPGGRIQNAIGAVRSTTPYNCFVSRLIKDSMDGIMGAVSESAQTMRMGGGIGYDFSTLRPRGSNIASINSPSSGPVSFMGIFDATCKTISAAGHRRGAQMGVLRVDHPDIEEFIHAKQNKDYLTQFNISVGVTDEFMDCLFKNKPFELKFNGQVYKTVNPQLLWDTLMRNTWEWAEPGVLFIDTINKKNNLWYCETISATNPCGEQPLPPYGACLLGSFNLVKYLKLDKKEFDYASFVDDINWVIRSMDNVVDVATYPLPEQEREAKNKRRMGIGITGLANAIEYLGFPYASPEFKRETAKILRTLRNGAYFASTELAREKGPFPLFEKEKYLQGKFIQTLPDVLKERIEKYGIRNSHLLSIAPTGTISLCADNVSSGCEPVFSHEYHRTIIKDGGPITESVTDYGYRELGVIGKTAMECSAQDHVDILNLCSKYVDSAVSKTCNIGSEVTWDEFKDVYIQAYKGGASGCTTYRPDGSRQGILVEKKEESDELEGAACFIDPITGKKTCD